MKKKYVIKNRFRFTIFIILTVILLSTAFNFISGLNIAQSMSEVENYKTVTITSGDTLWNIAETYMSSIDTRKAVFILSKLNNISAGNLSVGSSIQVPIYH